MPEPISGLQARADLWGQAVEEPARVHHVGDVPAEALRYPRKVDLGRPRLEWGWGADAPSDAMAPQPFQDTPWEFRAGGIGVGKGEKRSLLVRGRGGKGRPNGETCAAQAAGSFKGPGWLCGGSS